MCHSFSLCAWRPSDSGRSQDGPSGRSLLVTARKRSADYLDCYTCLLHKHVSANYPRASITVQDSKGSQHDDDINITKKSVNYRFGFSLKQDIRI